jgi:hypothetical protein
VEAPAGAGTATFTGLPPGVPFGAFVLASNADGESLAPWRSVNGTNPPTVTYQSYVAAGSAPAGPASLSATSGPNRLTVTTTHGAGAIDSVTQTEITVDQCTGTPCGSLPTTPVGDVTVSGTSATVTLPAGTPAGAAFRIQARELNTVGASAWRTAYATYLPLDTPLPPTSLTVQPQADGTVSLSFTVQDDDAGWRALVLSGYRPHAQAKYYLVRLHVPAYQFPLTVYLLPSTARDYTFDLADYDVDPGTYTVDVVAYDTTWGQSAPVSATAPLGSPATPPPAPVTVARTPAPPTQPTDVVVPPVYYDGWNQTFSNTMTWSQPATAPDEYIVTMRDPQYPYLEPLVVEVPGSQDSYTYDVPFANAYDVSVYAVSHQAGSSLPATAVGMGPGY